MWWPTMYQFDLTPPTMLLLDVADDDRPAPLCDGGDKAAYTRNTIIRCDTTLLSKSRITVTTMATPVVALDEAEAEGCGGLACKDVHGGWHSPDAMWWPTRHQGDPITPTTLALDPANGDQPAPLRGGDKTAYTSHHQPL